MARRAHDRGHARDASHPRRGGRTLIALVLSDDWELRGDGSGNMRSLQFATLRGLCDVYEAHGLRGSFNAETYQQLVHRRLGDEHPELAELADEWDETVREVHGRGHDVQLHLHPQWSEATYRDGRWRLTASWALRDYPPAAMRRMLGDAKAYLEGLLRPVDAEYRCVSFRAGSWALAPSDGALATLAELGIVFDTSIAAGLHYDSPEVRLDYRAVDEPFLPFYPDMRDARRVSDRPQPIVCLPTHTFAPGRRNKAARALVRRWRRLPLGPPAILRDRHLAPADVAVEGAGHPSDYSRHSRQGPGAPGPPPATIVSDLANLSAAQMREALDDVRRRADASGWPVVPVVLENHTKDIGDHRPFERFARTLAAADDVEVLTARELADGLRAGRYPVRTAHDGP